MFNPRPKIIPISFCFGYTTQIVTIGICTIIMIIMFMMELMSSWVTVVVAGIVPACNETVGAC